MYSGSARTKYLSFHEPEPLESPASKLSSLTASALYKYHYPRPPSMYLVCSSYTRPIEDMQNGMSIYMTIVNRANAPKSLTRAY